MCSLLTVKLAPNDIVPGRLFTNPEASAYDLSIIKYMLETLCHTLRQAQICPSQPPPNIIFLQELGGRMHRIALIRPERLLMPGHVIVVGFCGKKRLGIDLTLLDQVDDELIQRMPQYPHLLSYSTLQLESFNSVNMVLFDEAQGVHYWANSEKHAMAVSLSPQYYSVIRLHNAILPDGIRTHNQLTLARTKYYDFQNELTWQAVREYVQ